MTLTGRRLIRYLRFAVLGETKHPKTPRAYPKRRSPARNWKYRAWVRTLPCAVCGRSPSEAAHTGNDGGLRQKASDFSCVPLCAEHHRLSGQSYHNIGKKAFEELHQINLKSKVNWCFNLWLEYAGRVK